MANAAAIIGLSQTAIAAGTTLRVAELAFGKAKRHAKKKITRKRRKKRR